MGVDSVNLGISDAAMTAVHDGISGEVELRPQRKFEDARLRALVEAVDAERIAGFPTGRLFLDSIEQALAVALVDGHAVRQRRAQTYQGGKLVPVDAVLPILTAAVRSGSPTKASVAKPEGFFKSS